MRKTIKVTYVKDLINKRLANEKHTGGEKYTAAMILEEILHTTGNYKGYTHNYWVERGYDEWVKAGKPMDCLEPMDCLVKDKFIHGDRSIFDRTYH